MPFACAASAATVSKSQRKNSSNKFGLPLPPILSNNGRTVSPTQTESG
jgi:hypothetical protein